MDSFFEYLVKGANLLRAGELMKVIISCGMMEPLCMLNLVLNIAGILGTSSSHIRIFEKGKLVFLGGYEVRFDYASYISVVRGILAGNRGLCS